MLAEIAMLRLETALRNVGPPPCPSGDRRFVPKFPIRRIYNPQPSSAKRPA